MIGSITRAAAGWAPAATPRGEGALEFIAPTLAKAPTIQVPMLGSLGCPYTCGFCID